MEQCNYKVCINCLHVYLEKTKSPQKQQRWQQPALFLAGGCNCEGKGEQGQVLACSSPLLTCRRLSRGFGGLSPAAPSTCRARLASLQLPGGSISREHQDAQPSLSGSGSSSCAWDITGPVRQWMERCPLASPGGKRW